MYKKRFDELYLRIFFYTLQLASDKNQMQPLLFQQKSYAQLQYSTFRLKGVKNSLLCQIFKCLKQSKSDQNVSLYTFSLLPPDFLESPSLFTIRVEKNKF